MLDSFFGRGKLKHSSLKLSERVQKSVVDILRAQPKLALEETVGVPPLCWMIEMGTSLENIKAAYQVCPNVLKFKYGPSQELPLHMACRSASDEIIQFLVQEFPKATSIANASNLLPIHVALKTRPQWMELRTIQTLLRSYPESVAIRAELFSLEWISPLEFAIYQHYPVPVIEFMMTVVPCDMTELWMRSFNDISSEEIQLVSECFPQLKELKFEILSSMTDEDALLTLLHTLAAPNERLERLNLWLPIGLLLNNEESQRLLSNLFKNNHHLISVELTEMRTPEVLADDHADIMILDCIREGLSQAPHSSALQSLALDGMILRDSCQVAQFFASGVAPRRLRLTNTYWGEGNPGGIDVIQDWSSCQIECLDIENCAIFPPFVEELFHCVSNMPNLRELTLWLTVLDQAPGRQRGILERKQISVTHHILRILAQCPRLQKLLIQDTDLLVDIEPVCEVLCQNNTLLDYYIETSLNTEEKQKRLLDTLRRHNTTLQSACGRLPLGIGDNNATKILHWMLLNRFGRAKLRNLQIRGLNTLIHLLSIASEDRTRFLLRSYGMGQFNILYGLLHECPDLWCVP